MPRPYISLELRRLVSDHAHYLCEYCLIPEAYRSSTYQVDHIISVKLSGSTTADN
ncbi:HNH endonuclease [Tolypothrix sp. VBCCA 56010]|uniref:HNH endonuclease n=1 Tax=Tolypothrix sp. VBCCA 56010 TaxID=3137731 RepID=UPI003D7CB15F